VAFRAAQAKAVPSGSARAGNTGSESPGRVLGGAACSGPWRRGGGCKSFSNSISVHICQIKRELSSEKASGTELTLQLWYDTDVLAFVSCGFANIACVVFG